MKFNRFVGALFFLIAVASAAIEWVVAAQVADSSLDMNIAGPLMQLDVGLFSVSFTAYFTACSLVYWLFPLVFRRNFRLWCLVLHASLAALLFTIMAAATVRLGMPVGSTTYYRHIIIEPPLETMAWVSVVLGWVLMLLPGISVAFAKARNA